MRSPVNSDFFRNPESALLDNTSETAMRLFRSFPSSISQNVRKNYEATMNSNIAHFSSALPFSCPFSFSCADPILVIYCRQRETDQSSSSASERVCEKRTSSSCLSLLIVVSPSNSASGSSAVAMSLVAFDSRNSTKESRDRSPS